MHTPHRSSHHTVRDAKGDNNKMALHMLELNVVEEVETCSTLSFDDPVHQDMKKIKNGWLAEFIRFQLRWIQK